MLPKSNRIPRRAWLAAALVCGAGTLLSFQACAALFGRSGGTVEVPASFPPKGDPSTAQSRTINVGGLQRSYLIQPVGGQGPYPVVVVLHGGTQDANAVWKETSLPTLAQREGFIVVAPNGVNKHWNDGRGAVLGGEGSTADDVGFLRAVIAQTIQQDHGDAKAVFMVGPSNGGFMTQHYACNAADTLRAGANVISDLPAEMVQSCRPAKPLPWLSINGTNDPLIPFLGQGPGVVKNGQQQPALLSADETFKFWADHANCSKEVRVERLQGPGGQFAEKRTRPGCAGGPASVQYVMYGAGHVWPGTQVRLQMIRNIIGEPSMVVDSGTVIWDFFRSTLR